MIDAILLGFGAARKIAAARRTMLMAGAATVLVAAAAIGQLRLLGAPASAAPPSATPALSGSYAFAMTSICQADLAATASGGAITSLVFTNIGNLTQRVGVADFNTPAQTMIFSGTKYNAPLVQMNPNSFELSQAPDAATFPYSNTATTLTINGVLYSVVYASVSGGIAHYFAFAGNLNDGCTHSGHAMRQ
jgi:hypothetical protein